MKVLFEEKLDITFANKETVLELNGCTIEAFPSNHLDAFRSLTNPKFILLDEADFQTSSMKYEYIPGTPPAVCLNPKRYFKRMC